jgi:hypothetical protein
MPSWTNTVIFPGGRQDPEILDAEDDLTEDEFARQYGAQFVERVGRVMADWEDEVHLADLEYTRGWPLYLAVDYGFTNPFVLLWIQVDPFENVYVIREDRWTLKDTPTIAQEVKDDPLLGLLVKQVVRFYPDPAEPDDTQTLMRMWRKPAASNCGGEIKDRLQIIWKLLKVQNTHLPEGAPERRPRLLVDRRRCTQLAWEMREGYRWPEHKSDSPKNNPENPMDKDNHGCEALGRFGKGYFGQVATGKKGKSHKANMTRRRGGTSRGTRREAV